MRLSKLTNALLIVTCNVQKCSRAAQNALGGRMRPAGRSLPTPGLIDAYLKLFNSNLKL